MDTSSDSTPALTRLEALAQTGRYLFIGERGPRTHPWAHPRSLFTNADPERLRGWWIPRVGLLVPEPVVLDVFASPLAAGMLALSQSRGEGGVFHVDELASGAVAFTAGENSTSRGAWEDALRAAARCGDDQPVGEYFVNVVPRAAFRQSEHNFPFSGVYASSERVSIAERISLCGGDVRALAKIVGKKLPHLDGPAARADPFTGAFGTGGHLQFCPNTGRRLVPMAVPTPADRVWALRAFERRAARWMSRGGSRGRLLISCSDLPSTASAGPTSPVNAPTPGGQLEGVLKFIEANCTRSIGVEELASLVDMSPSRFHVVFRQATGSTPSAYVADRRLELAERLLTDTRLNIAEVAERCGFSEQGSLTRSLRRRRGVTPSCLRRAGDSAQTAR